MPHQTIVIGAGLAGLSAAYELVRAGIDVQVFEARTRVGGRVHTVQLHAGQYGELGAELVDDNHTALITYATELGIELDSASKFPDDLYWFIDGMLHNRMSLTQEQTSALDNLYAKLQSLLEEQKDPQQTLDEWLNVEPIEPFARRIARWLASALFATDSELIGVGFFAYVAGLGNGGGNMRVRGGVSRLVDAFAKHLGERVHTSTPVRRIQQTDETVSVSVETASGLVEVMTDSVIVTLPWSVLRDIPIEAPLINAQREAISSLLYGGVVKTLLQYPHRFWSKSNFGIVLLEGEYQAIWEPTFAQMGTERILSCFSGGTRSLKLCEQASDLALAAVHTIYPDAPEIILSSSHDWNADEWARGAYCYFRPGDLHRFEPYLTLPAGRIFFAGEHTAPLMYRGYMEGAIRSGQRATQQILNLLSE
ncbi:NAD(P)/FAD-dependent oxidoreductase [Brasilonema sp. UFV-L1]|uniref:flavin monoamine oxidase family protein n=1 Tax=Brasilonema sp. UFV-L1 TaxID=2234130 RepID=UPI00145DB516|nr:NAD(P)/FAD-dependent oxidoreductase [Brasilonema sp. UFV-L1]NMG10025.1 amine oxidase [Brasilonema sp. UFV-L1]